MARAVALALALGVFLPTSATSAQPADATGSRERATAKALGREGLLLYEDGDYARAAEKLAVAYRLAPVPTIGLWLGRALIKLGRLVEADARLGEVEAMDLADVAEKLAALQSERLSPEGLALHEKALESAVSERRELAARIPKIEIVVPEGATITIDGDARPDAGGGAVSLDPGAHRIVVTLGDQTQTRSVTLAEGEETRVTIELRRPTPEPPPSPRPEPTAPAGQRDTATTSTQAILGWTTLGLGSAAVVTGGILSLVALSRYGSLDCPDDQCGPSQHDAADRYNALRIPSGVLLIAGGAVAAAGLTIALTAPDDEASVSLRLGPTSLTFGGTF
ncbi:MAG: hypothetical protein KC731_09560 [Myxococcales bacterium]|nr:hypothetical protein [Myxococcales bacterium]